MPQWRKLRRAGILFGGAGNDDMTIVLRCLADMLPWALTLGVIA